MRKLLLATFAAVLLSAAPAAANSVVGFGLDFHYELGLGFRTGGVTQPLPVYGLETAKQLSGGQSTMAAVLDNGELKVAGGNDFGQNGNGRQWIPSPFPTTILHGVSQASAGGGDGLALMQDGTVEVWGGNSYGQLANGVHGGGTEASAIKLAVDHPIPVPGISGAIQVASFGATNAVLLSNGTVLGFGEDNHGQIGLPEAKEVIAPRPIAGLSGVVQIAAGGVGKYESDLYALKADGTLWTLGTGARGERGDGSQVNGGAPRQVKGLSEVSAIAGSRTNGAAVAHGQLYTWGWNAEGALGYATTETCIKAHPTPCSTIPRPVAGMSSVTSFDAGVETVYEINAGTLYDQGRDNFGQLGNGSTGNASKPQLILQGAIKVAALDIGALVETNATSRPPTRITATAGLNSITVTYTGGKEAFTIGLQPCTGGPKERSTKSKTVARTTAHSYTITGLLPGHEYEVSAGSAKFARSVVRAKTL